MFIIQTRILDNLQWSKKHAHIIIMTMERNITIVVVPLPVYLHSTCTPAFFRAKELFGLEAYRTKC